jgi:hypothetical protein
LPRSIALSHARTHSDQPMRIVAPEPKELTDPHRECGRGHP